jgi:8-oxo-dGTP pyrophosphatase MutT (NUDIX family)
MANINHITPDQLSKIIKPGAAGVLTMTTSGEFLLTKRTSRAHYLGGHWSVPSGEVDVNSLESMEDCARREFFEETTHQIPSQTKIVCVDRYFVDDRMYILFLYKVKSRFFVKIDWEHEDVNWFTKDNLPQPISSQIYDAIQRI